jgi:hypothetical protein
MFGLGATRAGTSWLSRYLTDHPECHMREIKEAHYFDTLDRGSFDFQIKLLSGRRAELEARRAGSDNPRQRARLARNIAAHDELLRIFEKRRADHGAYLAYLHADAGPARVVGEITPAYALLGVDWLRLMAGLAPVVRFVYVLREPVERLWSNIRQTVPTRKGGREDPHATALAMFDAWLAGGEDEIALRCDYRGVLERMADAIPARDQLVLFHETLFSHETLDRLCAFLGIRTLPADTETRIFAAEPLALDSGRVAAARARLAPQYDFVRDRFGALPPAWSARLNEV